MLAAASTSGDVIRWCLVLIGAICVLGAAIWLVRRWTLRSPPTAKPEAWSLQDLRDLRAGGQITEDEFQVLRRALLESACGTAAPKPPVDDHCGY